MSMSYEEYEKLQRGDVIVHDDSGHSYVIIASVGASRLIACRTVTITNPEEWTKLPRREEECRT